MSCQRRRRDSSVRKKKVRNESRGKDKGSILECRSLGEEGREIGGKGAVPEHTKEGLPSGRDMPGKRATACRPNQQVKKGSRERSLSERGRKFGSWCAPKFNSATEGGLGCMCSIRTEKRGGNTGERLVLL